MPGSSPEGKRQALEMWVPDSFRYFTKPGGPSGAVWHVWRLAALTHSDLEIQCLMAKP